jgi:hypothetical protein
MKTLKFMLMLAAAAAAGAVKAEVDSYLYWMVSDAATYSDAAGATLSGTLVDYDYAKISADGGSTYLSLYGPDGGNLGADTLDKGLDGYVGFASSPAFSSFLVELYTEDSSERVGWATIPYNTAMQYAFTDITQQKLANLYTVTQAIPEPTSGVLLLLGMAGLALRRRRNV